MTKQDAENVLAHYGIPLSSMTKEDAEEALAHYGVPGMKWGQRKARGGVKVAKKSKPSSQDFQKSQKLKAKPNRELSTKQLKALNERLQLESTRRKLDPGKIQRGHAIAKDVLAIGTTAASIYALSQTPLGKQVIASVKKNIG